MLIYMMYLAPILGVKSSKVNLLIDTVLNVHSFPDQLLSPAPCLSGVQFKARVFFFYLLHGDLWLRRQVLLGVADAGSVLVLGHSAHWRCGG